MRSALLFFIFLFSGCGSVEEIDWDQQEESVQFGAAIRAVAEHETGLYDASWNGIPAGYASFVAKRVDDRYETAGDLVTTGLAAMIHGMKYRFEGESSITDLASRRWRMDQQDTKQVDIVYSPEEKLVVSEIRSEGEEPEKLTLPGQGLWEPFGAVYALRQMELEAGRTYRIRMFAERNFYRADILVVERVKIQVPAGEFDTFHIRADVRMTENDEPIADPRPQAIWLTADDRRIPVRVSMKTDIGRIVLSMKEYEAVEPAPRAAP